MRITLGCFELGRRHTRTWSPTSSSWLQSSKAESSPEDCAIASDSTTDGLMAFTYVEVRAKIWLRVKARLKLRLRLGAKLRLARATHASAAAAADRLVAGGGGGTC